MPALFRENSGLRLIVLGLGIAIAVPAEARIHRSAAAVAQFKRAHPCPATHLPRGRCPGWIVDHVVALKRGGADLPCNMQWQTVIEAKEKDRWE